MGKLEAWDAMNHQRNGESGVAVPVAFMGSIARIEGTSLDTP